MRFQVTSKLIRPNSCIMQTVRQRIPNCWARNGESTSAESAATDARNDELTAQIPKLAPNSQILLYKYCFFARNTLWPSSHMHMWYKIFTSLGYWVLLAKTTFRTKIGGGWARGANKNLGPPTHFCNR